jgi:hypothetical protein
MPALYEGLLRIADWCLSRRRVLFPVALVATTLVPLVVGQVVLQDFPNSSDEYCYLYQAATLAEGRLWNAPHPLHEFFRFNYVAFEDGKVYGTFPPGWPLFLAGVMKLGLPLPVVNPLVGTLSLALTFVVARRMFDERRALLAAATIFVSGFFLFNAASYFAHPFCGALVLSSIYFAERYGRERRPWLLVLVGAGIGWAVLTRYYTGVVCAIPIAIALVRCSPGGSLRTLAWVALGGLPFAAGLMAYNTLLVGNPFALSLDPRQTSPWFAQGFLARGVEILVSQTGRLAGWSPTLLVFVYVWLLRERAPDAWQRAVKWMPVVLALGMLPYAARGGNQYGPRYYYEAFAPLTIFTVGWIFRAETYAALTRAERRAFAAFAVGVLVSVPALLYHAWVEHRVILERGEPYRLVAEARLTNAMIFLEGRIGATRSMDVRDLTRNGLDYSRPVWYVLDLGAENARLRRSAPAKAAYRYEYDRLTARGRLAGLAPLSGDP